MMSAAPAVSQWNTPWRSAAWLTGIASSDTPEPSVILTPSSVVRRSVSLIAAVGVGNVGEQELDLASVDPAALVEHVARDLHGGEVFGAILGRRAGHRLQHADPDRFLRRTGHHRGEQRSRTGGERRPSQRMGHDLISSNRRYRPGISQNANTRPTIQPSD